MSNLDTETIIKKILAGIEDAFNELDLPKCSLILIFIIVLNTNLF